ncbi:Eco57I restriction-modification methylase domain-containing protein [Lancefieldella parvula]|uniref:Eco57I restriction-modification methylase domain-containing protein n=1 Tax=Lancefieldella parvula TaxID=1382 RepID=UPI0028D5B012|nr:Eco57I restriction-modification methylase domain-containing protein [Lancefieldella parvula]
MESNEQHTIGSGFIESFDSRYPTRILETLLQDRTTGRNIIWADNEYEALGEGYMGDDEITVEKITGLSSGVIKPRIAKEQEHQSKRTKSRAEVFTPSWLCNQMNNDIDATWFSRRDVFNIEDNQAWHTSQGPIIFPQKRGYGWHAYVESPRLEITCGEAPFVCSRYDTVTGEILPVDKRIGFLDRKLRIVSEKTKTRKEWVRWALAALKASYGFEYQGDNLLLARINVFETFCEHLRERWGMGITDDELNQAAWIVSWNFWQMNGLTCAVPTNKMNAVVQSALFGYEEPAPEPLQPTLFTLLDESSFDKSTQEEKEEGSGKTVPFCIIYDWQENEPFEFQVMKGKARPMNKKFYAVIGNPPYQEEVEGTSDRPIFNYFMDAAYEVGEKVELITPARFLFNAGKTPKAWNKRMLNDPHLTVLDYEQSSSTVFANTDIKGGVAVTLYDVAREVGPIGVFSSFGELRSIQKKVIPFLSDGSLDQIMFLQNKFVLQELYADYPEAKEKISSDGKERRIVTSSFSKLSCFTEHQTSNDAVRILGLGESNRRIYKWIERKYIEDNGNLDNYKVIVPKANGTGAIGEVLSTPLIGEPLIGEPLIGYTQSFIGIGSVSTESEAEAILKYVKSKFARAMLGILKITQDNPPERWALVPLQDFTLASDINWSKSVSEIDQQLYAKYGLSNEEINFIESHVKEMN